VIICRFFTLKLNRDCICYLDYDPAVSKSDLSCLPLSCIQRFTDGCSRKEGSQFLVSSSSIESLIDRTSNERVEVKRKNAIKHHSYSISSSNRSNTPTGMFIFNFSPFHTYTFLLCSCPRSRELSRRI
jgi:hypothetical protein